MVSSFLGDFFFPPWEFCPFTFMLVFLFLSFSPETFILFTLPVIHFKYSKPTRTYCIAQWTLLSIMWQPGWEGRMDTDLCMAEALCFPLETLVVNQLYTPVQNKKFNIKKMFTLYVWEFKNLLATVKGLFSIWTAPCLGYSKTGSCVPPPVLTQGGRERSRNFEPPPRASCARLLDSSEDSVLTKSQWGFSQLCTDQSPKSPCLLSLIELPFWLFKRLMSPPAQQTLLFISSVVQTTSTTFYSFAV